MWGSSATSIWMHSDSQVIHYDGHSWKVDDSWGSHGGITAITGLPGGDVWIAADRKIYFSNKGSPRRLGTAGPNLEQVKDIQAVTGQSLYAVGVPHSGDEASVYHWNGTNWQPAAKTMKDNLNAAWYDTATQALWVAGDEGLIARYKNGVWDNKRGKTGQSIADLHGTDGSNILAVGRSADGLGQDVALVLRYDGSTWNTVDTKASGKSDLVKVIALPGNRFWAAGYKLLSLDGSGTYTWHTEQLDQVVWVPDANKPEEIWAGSVRRY